MRFETQKEGNVLIITLLEKRLNAHIALDFKTELEKLIREDNHWIVLNLAEGEFMDSSFLFVIVSSLRLIWRDGSIVISGAGDAIKRLFLLTKMDRVFQMFTDADEAITFLST